MPLPRQRLCSIVLALSIGAAAAPAALARPADQFLGPQSTGSSNGVERPAPTVVRVSPEPGFQWGDAEIGAGAALAAALMGAGGVIALRSRRRGARPATTS
jgi:hypothetical protein